MKGYVGTAFVLLMTLCFSVFIPDLIVYGTLNYKANAIVESTTKEAEMLGGITPEVKTSMDETIKQYGYDRQKYNVEFGNSGKMQQGGKFTVKLSSEYTFKAFNLLGTGVGKFTLPVEAEDSGISEVWYRN
ncbi:DUF4320 family protein [Bacillus sp. 1P06AnD]|uniref:DUF4320 family protein n=1 Tax=Bacillus sp. 1P06AnD TaxID=3132208 RepID=UPI00399F3AF2